MQKLRRSALGKKHRKQRNNLYDRGFTAKEMADLLKQQSDEVLQLHRMGLEARMYLKKMHDQEKHAFKILLAERQL